MRGRGWTAATEQICYAMRACRSDAEGPGLAKSGRQ